MASPPPVADRAKEAADKLSKQLCTAATAAGERGSALAKVAGERTKDGCELVVAKVKLVVQRDVIPALKKYMARTEEALARMGEWDTFKLRCIEDEGDVANVQIEVILNEVKRLYPLAALSLVLVTSKFISALCVFGEVTIEELLRSRSVVPSLLLFTSTLPGCAALYHYHEALADGFTAGPDTLKSPADVVTLALHNARRMPPAFWFSVVPLNFVTLTLTKRGLAGLFRSVVHARLRAAIVVLLLGGGGVLKAYQSGSFNVALDISSLPPPAQKALETVWYHAQKYSRVGWQQLCTFYQAFLKFLKEKQAGNKPLEHVADAADAADAAPSAPNLA